MQAARYHPPMRFTTTLQAFGPNATGIEVPEEVLSGLGKGRRVAVVATVNGYAYRTTVAPYRGKILMPFAAEHREASGLRGGETIEVELAVDDAPREVSVPDDLAAAIAADHAAAATFERLAFTHRKEYVRWVEEAKKPETRAARIGRTVEQLREGRAR